MRKLKVGLIGYGISGKVFHAPFLKALDEYELVAVVSSNADKVKLDLPEVQVVGDVETLLADKQIELVIITTPNTTHFSIAKQAILAGKHIVVEKPFVNHFKEAEELIELAEANQTLISVFHNRRWDNDFLTIKQCIQSGALGEIYSFESHFDRFRPKVTERWRDQGLEGSGTLYDLGSHLIDQSVQLFGLPETVQGDVLVQRENGIVDDYFHIVLGYGKLRVILHSSCLVHNQGPRFQVHGSLGSFIKYGLDSQENALKAGLTPGNPQWGKDKEEQYGELSFHSEGVNLGRRMETIQGSYQSFYKEMYHAIVDSAKVPVTGEEAKNIIKIIEAVLQSNEEKRTIAFHD